MEATTVKKQIEYLKSVKGRAASLPKEMTAKDIKFRCSSLGHVMTESRSKSDPIGDSCITHLVDCFVSSKYGRREDHVGKALDKGNEREEDSITLLSRISKVFYKKNDVRLTNDYITGETDLFLGESIGKAEETIDIKTSWSANTFFRTKVKKLDKDYYWQGMGYMALTGAKKHTVAYCLVNGTEKAISDEKRKLAYSMGLIDTQGNELYKERCKQIEINHIFDIESFKNECPWFEFDNDVDNWKWDIPMKERLHTITFDRDKAAILNMYNKIENCWSWMDKNLFKI